MQPDQTRRLPFIDGLRALAVISVVGFHVGVGGFSGGFTGVDVFFVISGFVIGGQIIDRLLQKNFSLKEFYAHRMLRILPPLLLVLIVGACVAFSLPLLPNLVRSINTSAAAAAAMISNQYFVVHSGYFDPESVDQPYLHTWSLGVEEQYYAVAPIAMLLLLLAARRLRRDLVSVTFAAAFIACCGSLLLGLFLAQKARHFPFYGMPTRIWEFMAGSLVVLANRIGYVAPRWLTGAGATAGLIAVGAAVVLAAPTIVFPDWLSGLSVIGAALLLWAGSRDPESRALKALSSRPAVAIGALSYSWYLWHWPVLFAIRTLNLGDWSIPRDLFGAAIALALASLTYLMLEVPCRRMRHSHLSTGRLNAIAIAGGLSVVVVAAGIFGTAELANLMWQRHEFDAFRMPTLPHVNCGKERVLDFCDPTGGGPLRAVVWGDSHAVVLWPAIRERAIATGTNAALAWEANCPPLLPADQFLHVKRIGVDACKEHDRSISGKLMPPGRQPLIGIVLAGFWQLYLGSDQPPLGTPVRRAESSDSGEVISQLKYTLDVLATSGLRVLVVAPVPDLRHRAPECLYAAAFLKRDSRECGVPRAQVEAERAGILDVMRSEALKYSNLRVIDPADVLCSEELCTAGGAGLPLYTDTNHLSADAVAMVVAKFKDDFEWSLGR